MNGRDADGNTPLILAAFYANPNCVALLLEKGADANATNKAGVTALIRAATNFEKTRLLVDAGAKVRVRTADLGNTPLILAARRAGNSRTVKLLLEHGADATERNTAAISPITSGAASGDLETVRFCWTLARKPMISQNRMIREPRISRRAFVRRSCGPLTPTMCRWFAYCLNTVPIPISRLISAARCRTLAGTMRFEAAELLIDHGANVNARDAVADFTPLHWAAGNETARHHLVKLLLGSGADPNAAGGEAVGAFGLVSQTPLLIAKKHGRTAIVEALVAAGAKDQPPPEKISTPQRALPVELDHSIIITSAEKALAALQTSASKSRESFLRHVSKQDCVSCHQQYLPMAAVAMLVTGRSASITRPPGNRSIWSLIIEIGSPTPSL